MSAFRLPIQRYHSKFIAIIGVGFNALKNLCIQLYILSIQKFMYPISNPKPCIGTLFSNILFRIFYNNETASERGQPHSRTYPHKNRCCSRYHRRRSRKISKITALLLHHQRHKRTFNNNINRTNYSYSGRSNRAL